LDASSTFFLVVVGRQVKPENVLYRAKGFDQLDYCCIADFGTVESSAGSTASPTAFVHDVVGTAGFMAPEMWHDAPAVADLFACDVFSLGVTAACLVSGFADPPPARGAVFVPLSASEVAPPVDDDDDDDDVRWDNLRGLIAVCASPQSGTRPRMADIVASQANDFDDIAEPVRVDAGARTERELARSGSLPELRRFFHHRARHRSLELGSAQVRARPDSENQHRSSSEAAVAIDPEVAAWMDRRGLGDIARAYSARLRSFKVS
jgi:serine/threonine protein kinase